MTNYRLGMFDENAYVHGMDVVKDMRDATGKIRGDTHFVVVAVYADGGDPESKEEAVRKWNRRAAK